MAENTRGEKKKDTPAQSENDGRAIGENKDDRIESERKENCDETRAIGTPPYGKFPPMRREGDRKFPQLKTASEIWHPATISCAEPIARKKNIF